MKIGIVGAADRAAAWENHLRPHRSVSEVIITAELKDLGDVDACFLLDSSPADSGYLLTAIKNGLHTFLIAPLPTGQAFAEQIYHAAEEANVLVQFSHWPTFAPASQWMQQQIKKAAFAQINREISHTRYIESEHHLRHFWVDELALCLKWMNATVHHVEVKKTGLNGNDGAIHLFLRFDSGATAGIFVFTAAGNDRHSRVIADQFLIAECDVLKQTVRMGRKGQENHLFFERKDFDASQAAKLATVQFLKSVQLNKPTLYNTYDLLQLSAVIAKTEERLDKFS